MGGVDQTAGSVSARRQQAIACSHLGARERLGSVKALRDLFQRTQGARRARTVAASPRTARDRHVCGHAGPPRNSLGHRAIWISAWIFARSARWLGGSISNADMRTVLCWASAPQLLCLMMTAALFPALGKEMLLEGRVGLAHAQPIPGIVLGAVGLVATLWSWVLMVCGLCALGKLSTGKSIGDYLLGLPFAVIPLVVMFKWSYRHG